MKHKFKRIIVFTLLLFIGFSTNIFAAPLEYKNAIFIDEDQTVLQETPIKEGYFVNTSLGFSPSHQIYNADLDNDGVEELVFTNLYANSSSVAEYKPVVIHKYDSVLNEYQIVGNIETTVGSSGVGSIFFSDFNGDGYIDIIVGESRREVDQSSRNRIVVHINNRDFTFSRHELVATVGILNFTIGDFNGDSFDDILYRESTSAGRLTFLLNNNGTFTTYPTNFQNVSNNFISGDIDNDGIDEVIFSL